MQRTIELAKKTPQSVLPNPRVAAVIVHRGECVAEAFHQGPGKAHAEKAAIQKAVRRGFRKFNEAELYVSLEPCVHLNKRTAPCAPLLIEKKFKRIVVGSCDPNPQVNGQGIKALKKAGLRVELARPTSSHRKQADQINQAFIKNQLHSLPYVRAKIAMSFDGKMALDNGLSQWITGSEARKFTHRLRKQTQFVGIGKYSVEKDDPQLNIRLGRQPQGSRVIVFGKPKNWSSCRLRKLNKEVLLVERDHPELLSELYEQGVQEILLEPGPSLFSSWLERGWIDQLDLFYGRGFLGGKGRYSPGFGWSLKSLEESVSVRPEVTRLLGSDVYLNAYLNVYRSY